MGDAAVRVNCEHDQEAAAISRSHREQIRGGGNTEGGEEKTNIRDMPRDGKTQQAENGEKREERPSEEREREGRERRAPHGVET